MNDFVAYAWRWRLALLTLLSVGFVILGLWMAGVLGEPPHSRRYPETLVIVIGWVSVVFFGLCGIMISLKLFDADEELRVGTLGIRWKSWSDQTIPWSEITGVTTWSFRGQNSIVLHLRDRARFPGKGLLAPLAGANRLLTGGDVSISMTGTDRSFAEALSAIEWFRTARS